MPNWNKVVVSGSNASLNSLTVSNGITGSLLGTASFALTSSNIQGGDTNYIPIWNTATSLSSSIIYQSGSNVGIGTTTPTAKLDISGSANITGSLGVTAGITGSLLGTASFATQATSASFAINASSSLFAVSSSRAISASFATQATSASFAVSSSRAISASFAINASSSLFATTSSFLNSTTNAFIQNGNSFGTTATLGTNDNQSLALETNATTKMFISSSGNVGIGTTIPSTKLDVSGSTRLNGDTTITGSLTISQSLLQYSNITSVTSGSTLNVASFPTSSFTAGFFDYVVTSGTNARAGIVFTVWNANNVEYAETSTNDIGNTTNLILSASVLSGAIRLQATSLSGSWSVKTLARMI